MLAGKKPLQWETRWLELLDLLAAPWHKLPGLCFHYCVPQPCYLQADSLLHFPKPLSKIFFFLECRKVWGRENDAICLVGMAANYFWYLTTWLENSGPISQIKVDTISFNEHIFVGGGIVSWLLYWDLSVQGEIETSDMNFAWG